MSRKADGRIDEVKPRMAIRGSLNHCLNQLALIIQIRASEPLYTDYLRPHCLLG